MSSGMPMTGWVSLSWKVILLGKVVRSGLLWPG